MPANERHPAPIAHRGVAGFIERMFSGFVIDYRVVQARTQAGFVTLVVSGAASSVPTPVALIPTPHYASFDFDVIATVMGPRHYALPNSPTGWEESRHGVRVAYGDTLHDPGRPDGLIADALGLGTDDERR